MGLFKVEFDIILWISPFLLKSTNSKMGLNERGFLWRETPVWGKWEGSQMRLGEPSDLKTSLIPSEGEERKFEWESPEGPPKWPCQFQVAVSFREQLPIPCPCSGREMRLEVWEARPQGCHPLSIKQGWSLGMWEKSLLYNALIMGFIPPQNLSLPKAIRTAQGSVWDVGKITPEPPRSVSVP